jgi:hypothetical protein
MHPIRFFAGLTCAFLVACGSEQADSPPPDFAKAFANLPLPPDPEFVSRSGGADALQITFYRQVLTRNNWRLVNQTENPDGSAVLYAEQKGPPLWVRISKSSRGGTTVELTGAVIDPDKTMPAPAGTTPKSGT